MNLKNYRLVDWNRGLCGEVIEYYNTPSEAREALAEYVRAAENAANAGYSCDCDCGIQYYDSGLWRNLKV